jgi:hypothetical protein
MSLLRDDEEVAQAKTPHLSRQVNLPISTIPQEWNVCTEIARKSKKITPRLTCYFCLVWPNFYREPIELILYIPGNRGHFNGFVWWADSIIKLCDEGRSNTSLFANRQSGIFQRLLLTLAASA